MPSLLRLLSLLLLSLAVLAGAPAWAQEEDELIGGDLPVADVEEEVDARDTVSEDDLDALGGTDPDQERAVQGHLTKAREHMRSKRFGAARGELDSADRVVPLHDGVLNHREVLDLFKRDPGLAEMKLEDIEKKYRDEYRRLGLHLKPHDRVIQRRGLPKRLDRAIKRLAKDRRGAKKRLRDAEAERDSCIGAIARANAAAGVAHCKPAIQVVRDRKAEYETIDSDFKVLTTAYRRAKGKKALQRLLRGR